MKKNVASQVIGVQMITAADGTAFTGTATALVTIDGGTQTASAGTGPTHEGNGFHTYLPTQAETNGDHIGFTFTGTGAIPVTVQVYTMFPQSVDNATDISAILVDTGTTIPAQITALNDIAATDIVSSGAITTLAGAVVNVDLVDVCTTNTDMRGTDSAATASALATVDANVDAVLVDTGTTLPASIATAQADLDIITGATGVNLLTATQASIDAIEVDTGTTIPALLPAALVGGRMDSNTSAIDGVAAAAANLSKSAIGIEAGSAITGTLSITQMTTDLTEATDDHYNGRIIIWTSGVLKNQATDITDYTGATKLLTYTATTEAPANTDTFVIV